MMAVETQRELEELLERLGQWRINPLDAYDEHIIRALVAERDELRAWLAEAGLIVKADGAPL